MNIITDFKNRQLFLSRDEEGAAPLWYDMREERMQLWEQYPSRYFYIP